MIYEKNNIILFLLNIISVFGQPKKSISKVVVAGNGDGTCKNPILHAGYIGTSFKARESKWIGAKIGFLALRNGIINEAGSVDIDWVRINK